MNYNSIVINKKNTGKYTLNRGKIVYARLHGLMRQYRNSMLVSGSSSGCG